jgi:hypothetical protein
MNSGQPFRFSSEIRLVELTGLSAHTLVDLVEILRTVSGSSIFYHTHHGFLTHHFEKPIVYNDFAVWTAEALREAALAERLAAIDLLAFTTIRDLRESILGLVEDHIRVNDGQLRECLPGEELHFCKSKSFVMPTGIVANDSVDFFAKLPEITTDSLYFHFLEARLRLGRTTNDFSSWLTSEGQPTLAAEINRLDPYTRTLDELKQELIELGHRNRVH